MTPKTGAEWTEDMARATTTTTLIHILETARLTAKEVRVIKAEIRARWI